MPSPHERVAPAFTLSNHAIERALDMNVEGAEIRDAFEKPRKVYLEPNTGATWRTRGRVSLCCRETDDTILITTIVWATANAWANDSQHVPLAGREDKTVGTVRRIAQAQRRNR